MKKIILIFTIVIAAFSCDDPYEGTTYTAFEELPMALYLESRPEVFSHWVELLRHTNLFNTFNLDREFTGFVPNNAAMEEYLSNRGLTSVTELDSAEANYLVRYHTLYGEVLNQSKFESGVIDWPTVSDDHLSIVFRDGGINEIYINNTSRIVEIEVEVTNGVIHVLDETLIPVTATVYDRISGPRYSIMKAAVDASGFADMLNTVSIEDTDEFGNIIQKRYYYTLFAVSDSIYNLDGISSFDDLANKLNVEGDDYDNSSNALHQYVAYHILPQTQSYPVLSSFNEGETSKNINTFAENELINISLSGETGDLFLNYDEGTETGTQVIANDIVCKNGTLHEVNTWMPVATPPTTIVEWDLADYQDLAAICDYFQSPNPNGGSSSYSKVVPADEVAQFSWTSIPAEKADVITYVNNRASGDGVRYNTKFHDHLLISPGAGGWVEIESPVIVEGTYKVNIDYISYLNIAEDVGQLQLYIDGEKVGGSFSTSNKSQERIVTKLLTSSISFDVTQTHTLRIVSLDGRSVRLDHIKLEPIN